MQLHDTENCSCPPHAYNLDNTNADPETRGKWIQLARKLGVAIRCVYLTASPKLCEHNDTVRALNGALMNPEQRKILPRVAFTGFASRFREPALKEGFQDITKVEFQVCFPRLDMTRRPCVDGRVNL